MPKLTKLVFNCSTGQQEEVALTAAEIAQAKADTAASVEANTVKEVEQQGQEAVKNTALAKLAELGLTVEDIEAVTR